MVDEKYTGINVELTPDGWRAVMPDGTILIAISACEMVEKVKEYEKTEYDG